MNLMAFISRGAALAPARPSPQHQAIEAARAQWIRALRTDELRAWMEVGDVGHAVLNGLLVTLTLAGMCQAHDDGHESSPQVRVIRGGIRAIEDCVRVSRCVVGVDHARAISPAVSMAVQAIEHASQEAIAHAAVAMRKLSGVQ